MSREITSVAAGGAESAARIESAANEGMHRFGCAAAAAPGGGAAAGAGAAPPAATFIPRLALASRLLDSAWPR